MRRSLSALACLLLIPALALLAAPQALAAAGDLLAKWGTKGSGDGQFNGPTGVRSMPHSLEVDRAGIVYAGFGGSGLQKFNL